MATQPPSPPAEAIQRYRELVRQSQQLASKISELELERNEYKLVEDTLRPLDPGRKAFRLVGGVLVERNVGEVLPSVQFSRENVSLMLVSVQGSVRGFADVSARFCSNSANFASCHTTSFCLFT